MRATGGWRRFFRLGDSPEHLEREVDDELGFHIEMLVERHRKAGMGEDEARRVVMQRFSGYRKTRADLVRGRKTAKRLKRRRSFLEGLGQDLRVTWRQVSKRPGYAAMAVLTLGLGIGASTTMFSVVNGVLLEPLPYPESNRLVYVGTTIGGGSPRRITAPEFLALKGETRNLARYAAYFGSDLGVLLNDRPEQLRVVGASEEYLDVFGTAPVLGHPFSQEDFRPGSPSVALVSHAVWQRFWAGGDEVIGAALTVAGSPSPGFPAVATPTVIGVLPQSMDSASDFWVPLRLTDTEAWGQEWQFRNVVLSSVGRLFSGRSLESLQTEVAGVASRLASEYPQHYSGRYFEGRSLGAVRLLDRMIASYRTRILVLFAGALLLLAIAVANVSGLFLSRALDRRQELAIRAALGGGRGRILRYLVTETMSIALVGGGLGFLLALGGLEGFRTLVPANLPRVDNLGPDLRVVLFALVLASASGLACGLLSLPSQKNRAPAASLGETSRTGPGRGTSRLRGFLVSAQVGFAAILLVGAGLLSGSLARLSRIDPGIEVDGLMVIPLGFPASCDTNETQLAFLANVVRRLDAVPGVVSVSWTPDPPLFWRNMSSPIRTEETVELSLEELPLIGNHPVGPGFLSTVGIPILRGRGITWNDDATSAPVVVVDEVAAQRLWPEQDPLGKQLLVDGGGGREGWRTVVGVAGRIHQITLSQDATPELYVPAHQYAFFPSPMGVTIRSGIPLEQVAGALRDAIWEVDRTVPIPSIIPARERVAADLQTPRLIAALGSIFSLFSLLLTMAAIVGLTAHSVTARTREVGLRLALGAHGRQVLWSIMKQCLRLALLGLGIGLALAAGASRFLDAFLFQVSPLDPLTFGAVAVALFLAALAASLAPALRATRVEPATALRWE